MDNRQGFLASAIVHTLILTVLSSDPETPNRRGDADESVARKTARVFMPPAAVLKQMAPQAPPPPAPPRARATPPPQRKDRISVGAPSQYRQKRLKLNRDDDLTKVAKGRPDAAPGPSGTPAPRPPEQQTPTRTAETREASERKASASRLRLPSGYGPNRSGDGTPARRSIAESVKNLDDILPPVAAGGFGAATGTVQRMGPLAFDPQGADFTMWINHFKNEVYRNWNIPQAAMVFSGHVDLQFTVLRSGKMIEVEMLKSTGVRGLDNAARFALLGARLLELPPDFGPDQLTIQVTFNYGGGPRSS